MIQSTIESEPKYDTVATPAAPDFTMRWESLQFLSDRFGEIDPDNAGNSPEGQRLLDDVSFARRLGNQIWEECGFIAFLDGQFGVLYEGEFPVIESDDDGEFEGLRPRAKVNAEMVARIPALEAAFPGVRFAVPHEDAVLENRCGLWAFVPNGLLRNHLERRRLGEAVMAMGELQQ